MANSSNLHEHNNNQHQHDDNASIHPQNNHSPHYLHQFDVHPLDLHLSSSRHIIHRRSRSFDHTPPPISSLNRETHVNFAINMFNQRIDQSQSQSQLQPNSALGGVESNLLIRSDRSFSGIEENHDDDDDDMISNEFEVDFGAGSGFLLENYDNINPNCDDDEISDSGESSPENYMGGSRVADTGSDSDEDDGEHEIIEAVDGGFDEDESLQLCLDAFHLENDDITNTANTVTDTVTATATANADFEWEEVEDRTDERETLSMLFGAEPDDDASVIPVLLSAFEDEPSEEHEASDWQVLSNVHNFDPNPDADDEYNDQYNDQYDDYNYTEHELFFGQFADSDASLSGRPPASKAVIANLSTVVVTEEDAVKSNVTCAVCKDEVMVGELATLLPCGHRFHGDCILPWLEIRNTCPVCRHELPTDDLEYERRKAERDELAL